MLDAVLEIGRADGDEAEVLVEALEAASAPRCGSLRRAGLADARRSPAHQLPAEADAAPAPTVITRPIDASGILHAGIEHPRIGERLALHRRPRRQVPCRLVAAVDIEIDALLLDREDELPGSVDVLQLAHAEVVEAAPAPGEVGGRLHFEAA